MSGFLLYKPTGGGSGTGSGDSVQIAYLRDEKASGTNGGTFISGSYQTRTINTEQDPFNIVSLSSNQFTLGAGNYYFQAYAVGYRCDPHKAKLRNVTDGTDVLIGSNGRSDPADGTNSLSVIDGYFTIASSKTFELQHRCTTTSNLFGYGQACSYGDVEVYLEIQITKIVSGTSSANPNIITSKSIISDITASQANVTNIAFSGLQVGKLYNLSGYLSHLATTSSLVNMTYNNGSTVVARLYSAPPNGDTPCISFNTVFSALSTTLTANLTLTGTGTVYGTTTLSFINRFVLTELNNATLGSF